jgi:excisionase family DNA binding protein
MTNRTVTREDELLTTRDLCEWLGISRLTLFRLRERGEGPPAYRIGKGMRYPRAGVERWLRDHEASSPQPAGEVNQT